MCLARVIAGTLLLASFLSSPANAQAQVVVALKIRNAPGSLGAPDANGRVTLTLASGDKVIVSVTDIDLDRTRAISGVTGNTSSSGPSMQELLLSPSMADATLRAKCEEEWKTDFRMRAYCEGQQKAALAALQGRGIATTERAAIRRQCAGEWPRDFRMMNYCEEQQLQALQSLGGAASPPAQPEAGPSPTRLLVSIRPDGDGWRIASQNPSYTWSNCAAVIGENSAKLSALEPFGVVLVRRTEFKPGAVSSAANPMVTCTANGATFVATSSR